MPRNVRVGLIQLSNPLNDESLPVSEIQEAMFQKHLPWIDKAGEAGVQILGLQEIFNGPYFCPHSETLLRKILNATIEHTQPTTNMSIPRMAARALKRFLAALFSG